MFPQALTSLTPVTAAPTTARPRERMRCPPLSPTPSAHGTAPGRAGEATKVLKRWEVTLRPRPRPVQLWVGVEPLRSNKCSGNFLFRRSPVLGIPDADPGRQPRASPLATHLRWSPRSPRPLPHRARRLPLSASGTSDLSPNGTAGPQAPHNGGGQTWAPKPFPSSRVSQTCFLQQRLERH